MPPSRVNPLLPAIAVGAAALTAGLLLALWNAWGAAAGAALAAAIGAFIARREPRTTARPVDRTIDRISRLVAERGYADGDPVAGVAALGDQLDLYRGVFEALGSAAVVLDSRGRVLIANPAAARLLERSPDELRGLDPHDLFTGADVHALCERAVKGEVASRRVKISREGFTGVFEGVAVPVERAGERMVILLLRDVTELAQAYELKTDFVGNASHELRTPIAAIRAAVDTLIGPARDDGPMRDRLATMIRDHVIRLEELVRDLLDLSRFESPADAETVSRVDCVTLCAEIETMLAPLREDRNITLSFEFDPRLRALRTNPQAFLLILRNLIDNAIKFSHPGGTVRVVGTVVEGERPSARFQVIDRGVGIPIAQQPRIFERFYQVDQARSGATPKRGTGLGLAIVKHALKRVGGSIAVESVWNEGTTMTVDLPLDPGSTGPTAAPPPPLGVA